MTTRREALGLLGSISLGALVGFQEEPTPALAPGVPHSPERLALIAKFKERSEAVVARFEPRTHRGGWAMPYRLFRPESSGKRPLVVFLHGSGGQGDDNAKQMGVGNIFGTRLWALPETQREFPCYVVVPQTDRGWIRYAPGAAGDSAARPVSGLGDGARLALEVIDGLVRDLPIDERRIYLTGQSLGGGGVWHLLAQRPKFFAAAATCCASATLDDPAAAARTPLWNFHGTADPIVAPMSSRDRIAALRMAGAHPLSTEYLSVGHNVWEWAYTEPALPKWLFSKQRKA